MHWAQRRAYRTAFGVISFVPIIVVVGLAVWSQGNKVVDRLLAFDYQMLLHGPRATVIRFCVAMGLVVVLQIGMSTIAALHMEKRPDLARNPGNKVMWIMLCAFFGSIFLPIWYFRKLRGYTAY